MFLCYANEDQEAVQAVYVQLKHAGFTPWMDAYSDEADSHSDLMAILIPG